MQQQNVHIAVVVEVRADHPSALLGVVQPQGLRAFGKGARAVGQERPGLVHGEAAIMIKLKPAVGVVDVQVAVVVEVDEATAPTPAAVGHASRIGDVHECAAIVAVQAIADSRQVGGHVGPDGQDAADEPVQVSVAVIVADGAAHAVAVDDDRMVGDVAESAVAVVEEYLGEVEVAHHQEVRVLIVVDPRERGREGRIESPLADERVGIEDDRGRDARRLADAGEANSPALAVVAPQRLRVADAAYEVAGRAPMAERQVQVAVEVVIAEGGRHGVLGPHAVQARARRPIGEGTVACVGEHERWVAVQARHQQVEVAVAIEIGQGRRAVAPRAIAGAGVSDAGFGSHLDKHHVALVPIQQIGPQVATHNEQVHIPVPVVVPCGNAARDDDRHFDVAHVVGEADGEGDAGSVGDIGESGQRRFVGRRIWSGGRLIGSAGRWGGRWRRRTAAAAAPAAAGNHDRQQQCGQHAAHWRTQAWLPGNQGE